MFSIYIGKFGGILLASALAVLVLWGCLIRQWRFAYILHKSGRQAKARIINRRMVRGRNTWFYVTYEFRTSGADNQQSTCKHEQEVSYSNYCRLKDGMIVRITYSARNPRVARLAGRFTDNTVLYRSIFFSFAFSLGFIVLVLFTLSIGIP